MKVLEKNDLEKILKLIAQGDPTLLLAEENLVDAINELCKNELVNISEGQISLTPAGEELLKKGGNLVVQKIKTDNDLAEFSVNRQKTGNILFLISFWTCLLSLLILLFIHIFS